VWRTSVSVISDKSYFVVGQKELTSRDRDKRQGQIGREREGEAGRKRERES